MDRGRCGLKTSRPRVWLAARLDPTPRALRVFIADRLLFQGLFTACCFEFYFSHCAEFLLKSILLVFADAALSLCFNHCSESLLEPSVPSRSGGATARGNSGLWSCYTAPPPAGFRRCRYHKQANVRSCIVNKLPPSRLFGLICSGIFRLQVRLSFIPRPQHIPNSFLSISLLSFFSF